MKSLNYGPKGWLLFAYQFLAYIAFTVFTNWPMNILADLYGGASLMSTLYTVGAIIAIVITLVISAFIGKIKSMKRVGCILGVIAMIFAFCVVIVPPGTMYLVCYFGGCVFIPLWATFSIGVLIGQWFPTKKGAFMGIVTLAFPITNGIIGLFAGQVFKNGYPDPFHAFLPYFIICLIGLIIGIVMLKDYPEQCGSYRDNDKNMTAEKANAILMEEIEAKKTSVWKLGRTLSNRDYWFTTIPIGALLMTSVGLMTQTNSIIGSYGAGMDRFGGFAGVMAVVMVAGLVGSFGIGLLDQPIGTKKALIFSSILMLISGLIGLVPNAGAGFAALLILAAYMGASSNFLVSVSAQYWRREDFSSVFATVNPVANIIQAIGPMAIAFLMATKGTQGVYALIMVMGIISVILMILFSPKHIKAVDDQRRAAAGKPVDDALVGRK